MSTTSQKTKLEGLIIETNSSPGEIELRLSGSSDSGSLAGLEAFLAKVHADAVIVAAKKVVVDCDALYFMNSSSVKSFVTWLVAIKNVPVAQRYSVCVRTNPRLGWQQRTFGSIQRSAPEVMRLE